jgi:hypothetical protein
MNMKLTASKPGIIAVALLAGVWPLLVSLAAYSIFGNPNYAPGRMRACLELAGSCTVLAIGMLLLLGTWHEEAYQAALFLCGLVEHPIRAAGSLFVRRRSIPSQSGSARHAKPRPAKAPPNTPHSPMRTAFVEQNEPIKINPVTRYSMAPSPNNLPAGSTRDHYTDLSPGARHFGIRPRAVFIESDILENYIEKEFCLGQNVAGTILAALAGHAAGKPGDVREGSITVYLVRRDDGCPVRLVLQVRRIHHDGNECVMLNKACDREIDRDFN